MTPVTQSQSVYEWGIGDRLRKAREHTGLGQKAFGDAIGISRNSVRLFPNGFGSHLSGPHVGVVLRRLLETGTTPHQLRHRFASRAYQATHDIRAVQELLRHASLQTVQIYTKVRKAKKTEAVGRLNLYRTNAA